MGNKDLPVTPRVAPLPFRYNDWFFRFTLVLLVSVFVSTYGGDSMQDAFSDPMFYWEFVATFVFATLLTEWIHFVTCWLDRGYDWERKGGVRLVLQITLGIIVPAIAEVFLAVMWFRMIGTDIRETTFIQYAFPLIVMLIAIFNMYYFTHYVYLQWKKKEGVQSGELVSELADGEIPVYFGGDIHYLTATDILYAYREGKYNYVKTSRRGESYVISLPLDELENRLDRFLFFRLNRQVIAHRTCCQGYIPAGYGKLQVNLLPPLPTGQSVVVSQKRAGAFREWIGSENLPLTQG